MAKGCTIAPEKSNSLDPDFKERAGRKFERGATAHDYHHEHPKILIKIDYDDDIKIGNTQVTHNKNQLTQ